MPRASLKRINKDVDLELKDNFAFLISSLSQANEIEQFFRDFLTKEEKIMLSKRLMLHLMLENEYASSQIQSVLGVSDETVRTHKNIWERGGEIYKKIIAKLARREKTKQFFRQAEKILQKVDTLMRSKTDMKARAKLTG